MTKGSKKPNPLPTTTVHVKLPDEDIRELAARARAHRPPCSVNALLRQIVDDYLHARERAA